MTSPIIAPEIRGIIPQLTTEEYQQLEASLLTDGCRDALVIWQGILLDGHHRLEICERHNLPYQIKVIDLPDKYEGIPSDLTTWAPEQFCQFMQSLIAEVLQAWKCKVVLLMSNLRTEGTIIDLPTKITHFLSQNKNYKILDHIVNEIGRPKSIGGHWVASASKGRWLLRNHIHIIVVADNAKS